MVQVDPATGSLAAPSCPGAQVQAFLAGTQPVEICRLHGGGLAGTTQVTGWETPAENQRGGRRRRPSPRRLARGAEGPSRPASATAQSRAAKASPPAEKKGLFRRLLDVFK